MSSLPAFTPAPPPLDDAYIHFCLAKNLAHGHGFAFRSGEPVAASTSPLWTMLLAAGEKTGLGVESTAFALSMAGYAVSVWLTYALARRFGCSKPAALIGAAGLALTGRFLWAAGASMEVTLFAAASLMAVWSLAAVRRSPRAWTGAWTGIAWQLRPEGILLALLTAAIDFTELRKNDGGRFTLSVRPRARSLAALFGIPLILAAPYTIFCLTTFGQPFPTTYYAKKSDVLFSVEYAGIYLQWLIESAHVALPLALLGLASIALHRGPRRETVPRMVAALWFIGLPLAMAHVNPHLYNHGRYVQPLLPFAWLLASVGLQAAAGFAPRLNLDLAGVRARPRAFVVLAAAALVVVPLGLVSARRGMDKLKTDRAAVAETWIGTADYIKTHVPPDAVLAAHDVGVLGYFCPNPIMDICGLVSPEWLFTHARFDENRLWELLLRRKARYLVAHRAWFPTVVSRPCVTEIDAGVKGLMGIYDLSGCRQDAVGPGPDGASPH